MSTSPAELPRFTGEINNKVPLNWPPKCQMSGYDFRSDLSRMKFCLTIYYYVSNYNLTFSIFTEAERGHKKPYQAHSF
jgi:hypothetical protein